MTTYSSPSVTVAHPIATVQEKFADFSQLQPMLEKMPAEQRQQVGDVTFTKDSICINTPQVGSIEMVVTERTPNRVAMTAKNSPVPLNLVVNMTPKGDEATEVGAAIEVEIPAMLKPFIGPKLQEAANQFGKLVTSLA